LAAFVAASTAGVRTMAIASFDKKSGYYHTNQINQKKKLV